MTLSWQTTTAISAAACITAVAATGLALKAKSSNGVKGPQKWVRVGTVTQLVIYPVKAFQGTHVDEATVTKVGLSGIICRSCRRYCSKKFISYMNAIILVSAGNLLRDRVFMVIDHSGGYTVQMKHPKLAVIRFSNVGNRITLSAPDAPDISFDLPVDSAENRRNCRYLMKYSRVISVIADLDQ